MSINSGIDGVNKDLWSLVGDSTLWIGLKYQIYRRSMFKTSKRRWFITKCVAELYKCQSHGGC